MPNQGVAIGYVLSNNETRCSRTFSVTARASDYGDEASGYEQRDDGLTEAGLKFPPGLIKLTVSLLVIKYRQYRVWTGLGGGGGWLGNSHLLKSLPYTLIAYKVIICACVEIVKK